MLECEVKEMICDGGTLSTTEALREPDVTTWIEVGRLASLVCLPGGLDPRCERQASTAAGYMPVPAGPTE